MLLVTVRNTWTEACKSVASLPLDLFKLETNAYDPKHLFSNVQVHFIHIQ
jgi:hypothetical protein